MSNEDKKFNLLRKSANLCRIAVNLGRPSADPNAAPVVNAPTIQDENSADPDQTNEVCYRII